jgi:uncharacterized membrane protein YhfC
MKIPVLKITNFHSPWRRAAAGLTSMKIGHGFARILLLLALPPLLLAACAAGDGQSVTFQAPPWHDGETSVYDVQGPSGNLIGTATWTWQAHSEGWLQTNEVDLGDQVHRMVVLVDGELRPIRGEVDLGGRSATAVYGVDTITITQTTAAGESSSRELRRPELPLDNGQTLQSHRALPLAGGYRGRYTNVIPSTAVAATTNVSVSGPISFTVPAGTFNAWHVTMQTGASRHEAWYTHEPPYLMLGYHNRNAGSRFELRAWQFAAGEPWQGNQEPAQTTAVETVGPTQPNWLFVATSLLLQFPLMLLLPIVAGWWIRRRYGVSWAIFGMGALTFIGSQMVHLPVNWALGLLGGARGVALWPLVWVALILGLTAGLSEEGARYLVLRFWLKRARGWRDALQFGAGHGGIEAIILGLLAALGLGSMILLATVDPAALGVPAADAGQARAAAGLYWAQPWTMPLYAGLERLFAIIVHVALAVLVMRSVTHHQILYLLAAIALHTAMNAWAVWAAATYDVFWVEAGVGLFALLGLVLIWGLREPAPASDSEQQTPAMEVSR